MTLDLFRSDNSSNLSTMESMIIKVQKEATVYNGDPHALDNLAFSAAGVFWLTMIQYTKFFGSQIGNHQLIEHDVKYWDNANTKTLATFTELKKYLDGLWIQYPDWDDSVIQSLIELWYAISLANGFKFVEGNVGDGIYWEKSLFWET